MKAEVLGAAILACVAGCGSSGGAGGAGELITVQCANGHAVQSFPGQSAYDIEATVWFVAALAAGEAAPSPPHITSIGAVNAGDGAQPTVRDGEVDFTCGMTIVSAGHSAPTTSVLLFERP